MHLRCAFRVYTEPAGLAFSKVVKANGTRSRTFCPPFTSYSSQCWFCLIWNLVANATKQH